MEAKLKHLEFIQSAITRMANNSFLLKGWTVTLIGGLLALTFKQIDRRYLFLSGSTALMFWSLDSYYLSQERKFIDLYNSVRLLSETSTDFSMHTRQSAKSCRWMKVPLLSNKSDFLWGFARCAITGCLFHLEGLRALWQDTLSSAFTMSGTLGALGKSEIATCSLPKMSTAL